MAHSLMRVTDSFTLAFTKFKTRRIRTILTLISTSILALILVVVSSVLTGFLKIADSAPQTTLTDLHLAEIAQYNAFGGEASPIDPNADLQKFKDSLKNQKGFQDAFLQVSANYEYSTGELDALKAEANKAKEFDFGFSTNTVARSSALLQPYVAQGQSLNWQAGQPLPVIVPTALISQAHSTELEKIKNANDRVKRRVALQEQLIGKTTNLTLSSYSFGGEASLGSSAQTSDDFTSQPLSPSVKDKKVLSVKIVGFSPTSAGIISGYGVEGIALPWEVVQQSKDAKALFDRADQFYPSFQTKQNRNAYVNSHDGAGIFADVVESNKDRFRTVQKVYTIMVIVMLVLMAIPMAATLSKILSDSQRETGVFRAIGARNRNILSIYAIYTLLLVISAFLLALVVGFAIAFLIDAKWADGIALGITDIADTSVTVNLVRFAPNQLGTIFLGMLAGSALGAAFPLIRSLRRDPIKSLRDE